VLAIKPLTLESIKAIAIKFNTHPAMIIGRLQRKKLLPYNLGIDVFVKLNFSDIND
jgi:hypothetical protein